MTTSHLDDELERGFLAEARDLLAGVGSDLQIIEHGAADVDDVVVNRIFRATHSIKSGAGFFDLTALRDLAQQIESALDFIRSRRLVPSRQVVGVLSRAFQKVEELIRFYREVDQPDIVDVACTLGGLIDNHLPVEDRNLYQARVALAVPEATRRVEASAFDLMQARRAGKYIYLIRYDLIRDIQRKGRTPWEVFKILIEKGTILETVLDLHSAGTLDDPPTNQLPLVVLYATALGPDSIRQLTDLPQDRISLIESNQDPQSPASLGELTPAV